MVANADGIMGKNTIGAINKVSEGEFIASFSLARIERFSKIVAKDPSQNKFFRGWVNRVLREMGRKV